jgi:hypothetical protein
VQVLASSEKLTEGVAGGVQPEEMVTGKLDTTPPFIKKRTEPLPLEVHVTVT